MAGLLLNESRSATKDKTNLEGGRGKRRPYETFFNPGGVFTQE